MEGAIGLETEAAGEAAGEPVSNEPVRVPMSSRRGISMASTKSPSRVCPAGCAQVNKHPIGPLPFTL